MLQLPVAIFTERLQARCFRPLLSCASLMPIPGRRAKAKANRAAQVRRSNARRDARLTAVRTLNTLAEEITLPGNRAPARGARYADVERLVRLLEVRLATPAAVERLRAAAQMWTDNGGRFSTPVLEQDYIQRRLLLAATASCCPLSS